MEFTMSTNGSLAQIRRKAYLAYHQDGIIDLCIGAIVLGFGLWRLTGIIVFSSLSWLFISFYIVLKRSITIPRFGFARFNEAQRKTQISIAMGLLILLVLALGGLFFFARPDQIPPEVHTFMRKFHEFVMSGIGAFLMVLFGFLFGIKRVVGYGLLMLTTLFITIQLGWPADLTLLSIGTVILLIGIGLLISFLRRYPRQPTEA
jgi:hypothetical protein